MPNMQTALQAMDVALKQTVSLRDETKVFSRAIFWRDDTKSRSLGDGAEVIPSLMSLASPVTHDRAVFTILWVQLGLAQKPHQIEDAALQ